MYLKKLEIQGFKSFADKTKIEFKPGMTVIVGPNGSGKSNVADAIRWVLGEQSVKSLRGGKMEDVIFAGSDKRRSLGMAEVSLTIDNSSGVFPLEFNEITVTRRLYRSGESDYLINRVSCRLRDVHELFMDTGIGREGISIIGQGKVDEILTIKPGERRGIIEEAAGIVKYRHRKREAERKLEDTENSLLRLGDIIHELSSQEEPLADEARKAGIYRNLKNELDDLEIGLVIEEIDSVSNKLENLQAEFGQEEKGLDQLRTAFFDVQSREEEYKLELQKKDESIYTYQEKIYAANLHLEKSEGEKKLAAERIADTGRQEKSLNNEIKELDLESESITLEYKDHQQRGHKLLSHLENAKSSLEVFEDFVEKENQEDILLSEKLEGLKNEHFDVMQEESNFHNDIKSYNQRLEVIERQEDQVKSRQNHTQQEMKIVLSKITELDREATDLLSMQSNIREAQLKLEQELQMEEKNYKDLQKNNRNLLDEKNSALTRKRLLLDMEKEGQGYGQGVRELLRQKGQGQFSGVIGSVAQVINVPKEYELAVEVVLGGTLQHLITDNENTAKSAIGWLKNNDKGRVTFLPLTTVKAGKSGDQGLMGPGVVGRLSELINYDPAFAGIMEYLLGRIWLVENLDNAVQLARQIGFRYRIVTLDGQVVNAGGSLTGGSVKQNPSGILSRKRNVNELTAKIQEIEHRLTLGEREEINQDRKIEGLKKEINNLKERMQDIYVKKAENEKIQERWRAERDRCKTELESILWQLSELLKEKENITIQLRDTQQEANLLKNHLSEMVHKIKTMQESLITKRSEKIKKNERLTQLRIEVATVEEKMTSYQKECNYFEHRLKQLNQQKLDKTKEYELLKEKKRGLKEEFNNLETEKEKQLQHLLQTERNLENLKAEKLQIIEGLTAISDKVKELNSELRQKEEKIHQFELYRSRYETSLEAAQRRLCEQYNLLPEEARHKGINPKERRSAQARIQVIKDELTELGEVNLGTIEEYAKLTERLLFLKNQVMDMTDAKERLHKVINEMDQIMTKRFKETFIILDQSFQEMFQHLFGGGRAQLILTEADNPLEAGVDIVAQPPGKKTQYLSLLSGGEKALTAIALLMAVLKVKPSPFCVLDEIESNLDEANVYRFAQLINEFSQDTQFIIVSHRKGTMEIASILYGVTIDDSGVSRLVSVQLDNVKKEAS